MFLRWYPIRTLMINWIWYPLNPFVIIDRDGGQNLIFAFKPHNILIKISICCIFLAHLIQRVMWGIVITWRPSSSSVNFYILIFFYLKPLGPLEPKSSSIWWSIIKFMGFFCWSKVLIRNKRPKGVKRMLSVFNFLL